ncbi:MAG TPA: hypothetical protein VFT65_16815 [Candidatus Angelobacter sp.]|nr:hypothetical protein [Candidatus Angelobacter sp.]
MAQNMRIAIVHSLVLLLAGAGLAAPRPHVILLGRWRAAEATMESGEKQPFKVRDLFIDGKDREHTVGSMHEVTDRFFVIRRVLRVNDALQGESKDPQWIWRFSAWISVDRQTGRIALVSLPAFDYEASAVSWYRDYAAYCGPSDDGSKSYMVVAQMGSRKPVLRKEYSGPLCPAPKWDRTPSRVTFLAGGEKNSFVIHAHSADPQPDSPEEEGPQ